MAQRLILRLWRRTRPRSSLPPSPTTMPGPPPPQCHGATEHWGDAYETCNGLGQSPIDIVTTETIDLVDLTFDYQPDTLELIHNAHTYSSHIARAGNRRHFWQRDSQRSGMYSRHQLLCHNGCQWELHDFRCTRWRSGAECDGERIHCGQRSSGCHHGRHNHHPTRCPVARVIAFKKKSLSS